MTPIEPNTDEHTHTQTNTHAPATYNVPTTNPLSSGLASPMMRPTDSALRFTVPPSSRGVGGTSSSQSTPIPHADGTQVGLANYQSSQAAVAAQVQADREARIRRREERDGLQRRPSASISRSQHRTDMNGHVYSSGDDPPQPPPIGSLHRSPSFDKRLIDSARFAGREIEEEEEEDSFTCAGVCRGSCCAPTSTASSHYSDSMFDRDVGRELSSSSMRRRRGWYCHRPEASFVLKVLGVLLLITAGVVTSVLIFRWLHTDELNTWREAMFLRCTERSSTILSQLDFSTTAAQHHVALYSLIKGGSVVGRSTIGDEQLVRTYANVSNTHDFINFVLYISIIRNAADAIQYEANYNRSIFTSSPAGDVYYDDEPSPFSSDFFARQPGNSSAILPIDFVVPEYQPTDLRGYDIITAIPIGIRFYTDLMMSAQIGSIFCSNRSTLLSQGQGWGLVIFLPLYSTLPLIPPVEDRIAQTIGGIVGILPLSLIVERAIVTLDPQPIDLILIDKSAPVETSYLYTYYHIKDEVRRNATMMDEDESSYATFMYGERNFEVQCIPSQQFVETAYSQRPILVAIVCAILFGVVLFMVVMACLYSSMRRAIKRSTQLIQANRNKNLAMDLLHEAKRISDDANQSKSDFLAFLCHELRNPLHAIVAMIDFLKDPEGLGGGGGGGGLPDPITGLIPPASNPLSELQQESIETIQNSVNMMSTIVNDALDMSKIEAGKISFEIMRFSFIDLLTSLAACEKPRAQAKGVQLLLNINPNVPHYLYGDPTRIRQVCTNLLSNSIKFTFSGYVAISLSKISVDSFALPMMQSVEEAGESKLQSDISHTIGGPGANGLQSMTNNHYRQPPGATPIIPRRMMGGGTTIDEIAEDESGLLIDHRDRPASTQLSPQLDGDGRPYTFGPSIGDCFDNNGIELAHIDPMRQVDSLHDSTLVGGVPLAVGIPRPNACESIDSARAPRNENAIDAAPTTPFAPFASPMSVEADIDTPPPQRKSQQFTHVPLQPSVLPSSNSTILDITQGADRPVVCGPNSARENLPAGSSNNSRPGVGVGVGVGVHDHSVSRSSATRSTFVSENVILEISVTDSGVGIDEAALPLLFEPYSQAKLSVMRSFGGTGLGLAIVKQIVEMMQGSISVKSQVGEGGGTTMTIRLPLPTAPSFDHSGESSENSHGSSQASAGRKSNNRPDALIRPSVSNVLVADHGSPVLHSSDRTSGSGSAAAAAAACTSPVPNNRRTIATARAMNTTTNTPQSIYSTMDLSSRTNNTFVQQSTPSHPMRYSTMQQQTPGLDPRVIDTPASTIVTRTIVPTSITPNHGCAFENEVPPPRSSAHVLTPPDESLSASPDHSVSNPSPITFHDDATEKDGDMLANSHLPHPESNVLPSWTTTKEKDVCVGPIELPIPETPNDETHTRRVESSPNTTQSPSHLDVQNRLTALAALPVSPSDMGLPPVFKSHKPLKLPRERDSRNGHKPSPASTRTPGVALLPAYEQSSTPSSSSRAAGSLAALAAGRSTLTSIQSRDFRILIVDDSMTNLKILARMLAGFDVTQALNGLEAVEKVRALILADPPLQPFDDHNHPHTDTPTGGEVTPIMTPADGSTFAVGFSPTPQHAYVKESGRQFHLILSDIVMPVMDGQASSREIRKLERRYHLPPVPIVALTANAFMEDRNKCAAAGMSMFLSKPFSRSNILSIIQLVCSQNQLQLATSTPSTPSTLHASIQPFLLTPVSITHSLQQFESMSISNNQQHGGSGGGGGGGGGNSTPSLSSNRSVSTGFGVTSSNVTNIGVTSSDATPNSNVSLTSASSSTATTTPTQPNDQPAAAGAAHTIEHTITPVKTDDQTHE